MTWGDRWLELVGDAPHAPRARGGALTIVPGSARYETREGRRGRVRAELHVEPLADGTFDELTDAVAGDLRATAAVLEGRLPEPDEAAGADAVLPAPGAMRASCTCGARQPCRHVVALHRGIASTVDDDPAVLLRLRGRTLQTLAAAVRRARSGDQSASLPGTVALDQLVGVELGVARGDLDAIELRPRPVEEPSWLLQQLGPPPGVDDATELGRHVDRAASFAWRLAAGEGAGAADEQVLLAELRAQRMTTAARLAAALAWDPERVRAELDRLFDAGAVLRTGTGDRTRYRAR